MMQNVVETTLNTQHSLFVENASDQLKTNLFDQPILKSEHPSGHNPPNPIRTLFGF